MQPVVWCGELSTDSGLMHCGGNTLQTWCCRDERRAKTLVIYSFALAGKPLSDECILRGVTKNTRDYVIKSRDKSGCRPRIAH